MRGALIAVFLISLSGCGQGPPAPDPTGRVQHWLDELRGPVAKQRQHAAFTLGNLGTADPAVIPALSRALKDTDADVRCAAILALLKCGAGARDARADLVSLQEKDPEPKVREYAAKALKKLKAG